MTHVFISTACGMADTHLFSLVLILASLLQILGNPLSHLLEEEICFFHAISFLAHRRRAD
jgi:hypothetical protein